MATYQKIKVPQKGEVVKRHENGSLLVPDNPITPFIETVIQGGLSSVTALTGSTEEEQF